MTLIKRPKKLNFDIPKNPDLALERAINLSLKMAFEEKKILGDKYTEENFRYTVMLFISELNHFGSYPNKDENTYHLCFQHKYTYEGLTNKESRLIPDIVCLKKQKKGNKYCRNHPFVIELKKDGKISPAKKSQALDLSKRINKLGSCIESDILKTRIYLSKGKDSDTFRTGIVLNIITDCGKSDFLWLEAMLNRQQKELKKVDLNESNKRLLFGWYNPKLKAPELIWLNQKEPIKLKGIENFD